MSTDGTCESFMRYHIRSSITILLFGGVNWYKYLYVNAPVEIEGIVFVNHSVKISVDRWHMGGGDTLMYPLKKWGIMYFLSIFFAPIWMNLTWFLAWIDYSNIGPNLIPPAGRMNFLFVHFKTLVKLISALVHSLASKGQSVYLCYI